MLIKKACVDRKWKARKYFQRKAERKVGLDMWVADQWKDYEVLDCSSGEKLERWGSTILIRPTGNLAYGKEEQRMEK